jgi:hypothetical protein
MSDQLDNQADGYKGETFPELEVDGYVAPDEDQLQAALVLEHARRTRMHIEMMAASMDLTMGLCGDE